VRANNTTAARTTLAGAETRVAEPAIQGLSPPSESPMIQPLPYLVPPPYSTRSRRDARAFRAASSCLPREPYRITNQSFAQRVSDPGLENGKLRLGELCRTLPSDPAGSTPWPVKTLENPRSPLAVPGAVDSFARGCIQIVLGRGAQARDQAFVLGFIMGAARVPRWQRQLFRHCARHLYTGDHRFSEQDAQVFDFAFDAAGRSCVFALHRVDFRKLLERPLAEIRRFLGIEIEVLRGLYATERERWPLAQATPPLPEASRSQRAEAGRVVYLAEIRQARASRSAQRSRAAERVSAGSSNRRRSE
jgi:hypothetical protein